jgi:hypothetical protein
MNDNSEVAQQVACGRRVRYHNQPDLPISTVHRLVLDKDHPGHYLTCPHRGPVLAATSAQTAGCGCSSSRVEFYECRHFGEPTLKQCAGWAASANRDRLTAACPGYAGRTCRECTLLKTAESAVPKPP